MIRINGKEIDKDELHLSQYIEESGFDRRRIAVELNGSILPRDEYDSTLLCAGDKVEIVSFVGGG
ncbi:MAG: sulfur carrier protein ThiS [Anaerovoracaceae bacterium]|jgi:sulfur carrier protein